MRKTYLIAALALCASAHAGSKYPYLPNPQLTPGVVQSTSAAEVCEPGYPERARNVTATTKKRVYQAYGIDKDQCVKGCKIDHLIPLSIGGANDPKNLWPHEYGADWNVYAKTRLEVRLRKEVCSGSMPIQEAQSCIQSDWTKCYSRFYQH